MAPNGHKVASRRSTRQSDVFVEPEWLKLHGKDEFKRWCFQHPSEKVSYDEWKSDEKNTNGLALFYATKTMIENVSSDEEDEPIEAKSQLRVVQTQSAREPKKKASTTNTSRFPRTTSSTTSSPLADSGSVSPSGKRKRKPPRKYLSEEIIASEDSSEEEIDVNVPQTTAVGTATPTIPTIKIDGRRKSSSRRPRKKPISEETISPEDEIDDPMVIDAVAPAAIASPLPVRSAPKASVAVGSPAPPKKTHILKLRTGKALQKRAVSEDAAVDQPTVATTPVKADAAAGSNSTKPDVTSNGNAAALDDIALDTQSNSAAGSPDPTSTRRGLRTRKPAQQRPYYHDAQQFEDASPISATKEGSIDSNPDIRSRRVSLASLTRGGVDDDLLAALDEETAAILQEEDEPEPADRRPKHFKGKGRAWKKEESDEDEEFTLAAKKKAAKAAKAKANAEQKKRGRPRKSVPRTEEVVNDSGEEADSVISVAATTPTPAATGTSASGLQHHKSPASPSNSTTSATPTPSRSASKDAPKRKRAPTRKSVLSAEIIQDSSDIEVQDDEETVAVKMPSPVKDTAATDSPASGTGTGTSNGSASTTPLSNKKAHSTRTSEHISAPGTPKRGSPRVTEKGTPRGTRTGAPAATATAAMMEVEEFGAASAAGAAGAAGTSASATGNEEEKEKDKPAKGEIGDVQAIPETRMDDEEDALSVASLD